MIGDLKFEHEKVNGFPVLVKFRYTHMGTGELICEMVGNELVWYIEPPHEEIKWVVQDRFEEIQREFWLTWVGLLGSTKMPIMSKEDLFNVPAVW